jgi:hypothetical protein
MGCKSSVVKIVDSNYDLDKNMKSSEFKEIIVFEVFEVENGVLGLDRDCYLSIVRFLDSSIVRKVSFVLFNLYFSFDSILELVKNHLNE